MTSVPASQPLTHLRIYNRQDLVALTRLRRFETKMGERIQVLPSRSELADSIKASPANYVLFGIPEDLGRKASGARGGADTIWIPFLQSLLNTQSNDFLDGNEILLLGHFDFGDIEYLIDTTARTEEEKTEAYRHAVNSIDEEVEKLVKIITSSGKMPLVLGGGHNNAYPIIKGAAKGWFRAGVIPLAQINCVNLDAHAHFGPAEGRHSNNAFRYADEDGFLQKYCVIGVHENHLPQNVWMDMVNNPFIDCITYEDIFVLGKRSFGQAVAHATGFTDELMTGIDVDLDAVLQAGGADCSCTGVSPAEARQYVSYAAGALDPAYLFISGVSGRMAYGRTDNPMARLAAYLVTDFIKARKQLNA
ncbi:MAG: arginase [Chitinophagaceae bacterium]|nr:MAG: arginase [Chitinophagaceae bacterium]